VELGGVSEQELIARLRTHDQTAFELIYRVFHPRLIAIAQGYVQSAAIAEELAQDTLLMVWERRMVWRDDDSFVVYAYATVRNRALKHVRHEGVVGRVAALAVVDEESPGQSARPESADDAIARADLITAITAALGRLPELQRTAFVLRWVHHLSYEEVAAVMQLSEVAVRKHVSRARATLVPIAMRLVGEDPAR